MGINPVVSVPKLVCFGNLTLDDIAHPDGTMQPACIGGDALYGVLAARLFEPSAEMVAPIGRDFPPRVRAMIDAAGLSDAGLAARDCPTMRTRFAYETHDRRVVTLLSDERDFDALSPHEADVPEIYWNSSACMILAMTLNAQDLLVSACRARSNAIVALDPQEEYIAGNEQAIMNLVARVDVFMPSLDEVGRLLGHTDALVAARHFTSVGPRIAAIKLGAQGCLIYDAARGRAIRLPAYPGLPVDTTGGGDSFCSAFMASLVSAPSDLTLAAACGAVAAGFTIAAYGADALFRATPAQARERLLQWPFRSAMTTGQEDGH